MHERLSPPTEEQVRQNLLEIVRRSHSDGQTPIQTGSELKNRISGGYYLLLRGAAKSYQINFDEIVENGLNN